MPSNNDRFTLAGMDVSISFYRYQLDMLDLVDDGPLFMESNVQEILGLSSILLSKPRREPADLDKRIPAAIMHELADFLTDMHLATYKKPNSNMVSMVHEVLMEMDGGNVSRTSAMAKLCTWSHQIDALPNDTMHGNCKENELITTFLLPCLAPIMEDASRTFVLRWPAVANEECKGKPAMSLSTYRPDACTIRVCNQELGSDTGVRREQLGRALGQVAPVLKNVAALNQFQPLSAFTPLN
ncbi:hypothetical protein BC940DRAFT_329563 [Gongronella butleri]|nr:hypothetical protein BC940DRAFT_329563 [Gongronella butleri]